MRLLGAVLILAATGSVGFHMAAGLGRQAVLLRQFCTALEVMHGEVQYNQTRLPQLCRVVSQHCSGAAENLFGEIAAGLERDLESSAAAIFQQTMERCPAPAEAVQIWYSLAQTFGRYDPQRQGEAIAGARQRMELLCRRAEELRKGRCRQFRLFGVCAGAAIVLLLL